MNFYEGQLINLPCELLQNIFSRLSASDLCSVSQTCLDWRKVSLTLATIWRPVTIRQILEVSSSRLFPELIKADFSHLNCLNDEYLNNITNYLTHFGSLSEIALNCGACITQSGLSCLGKISHKLVKLALRNSDMCRSCFSISLDISLFRNLTDLDLSFTSISEDTFHSLSAAPNLTSLNLSHCCDITDETMRLVSNIKKLKALCLSKTNVTDEGIMVLGALNLQVLDLSKCDEITDVAIFYMRYFSDLENLDISQCPHIMTAGFEQLRFLDNLKTLNIQSGNSAIAPSLLHIFSMNSLEVLSLRNCHLVDEATMMGVRICKNLTMLDLHNCHELYGLFLSDLIFLKSLKTLNLSNCYKIDDYGISSISCISSLEVLDLTGLYKITLNSISPLSSMPHLKRLVLDWCSGVFKAGFTLVQHVTKSIKEVSLKGIEYTVSKNKSQSYKKSQSYGQLLNIKKYNYEQSVINTNTKFYQSRHFESCIFLKT